MGRTVTNTPNAPVRLSQTEVGESSTSSKKRLWSTKSIKAHLEFDARDLFKSSSSEFFACRLHKLGLAPRFGGDDWIFNESCYKAFVDKTTVSRNVIEVMTQRFTSKEVTLDMLASTTGLTRNPRYRPAAMVEYDKSFLFQISPIDETTPLLKEVAPYTDPELHYHQSQAGVLVRGLQENQVLVVKWFIANFVGVELRGLMTGKVAYFLHHVQKGDLLRRGWCPVVAIHMALVNGLKGFGKPLPNLCCRLWILLKNKTNVINEISLVRPTNLYQTFKCDIPGFWNKSSPIVSSNDDDVVDAIPFSFGKNLDLWRSWLDCYGEDELGGGWQYDNKNTLGGSSDAPLATDTLEVDDVDEHAGSQFVMDDAMMTDPQDGLDAQMGGDTKEIADEAILAQEAIRLGRRRRTRDARLMEESFPPPRAQGSATYVPYTYTVPADGPIAYQPGQTIPLHGYFSPAYMGTVPPELHQSAIATMLSLQLRFLDTQQAQFQSGLRLTDADLHHPGAAPQATGVGADHDTQVSGAGIANLGHAKGQDVD